MASGANITITGGTEMRQVVAGTDLVEADDFNKPNQNNDFLLNTAQDVTLGTFTEADTYGWGQGGTGVSNASVAADVLATGASGAFKDLQDDVQAACAFLGQTLRTGVGTDVTSTDTITAQTWNNLMLNIEDCWNNRFSPASVTTTTDATTSAFTGTWTNTLTQVTTWTFSNEDDARAFFNGGGRVGMSWTATDESGSQNDSWEAMATASGDFFLGHDTCTAGAGTIAGLGFYELTTSDQQLWQYFSPTSPYTGDYVRVLGRVNSTTDPTVITLTTEWVDAGDNVVDESVTSDIAYNARREQPDANGSGFSFPVPTDAAGAITGS